MIEIKVEPLFPNLSTLTDLFKLHWDEIYGNDNPQSCDIDLDQYKLIQDAGISIGLFAYYEDVIVGYSINMIIPNMHSKGNKTCVNDALYVDPAFRTTPLGLRLMNRTEEEASSRGASRMVWYAPVGTSMNKILTKKKYKHEEEVFSKILKEKVCQ